MKIYNTEIAKLFNKYANLLEIEGANLFRVRAYRNAVLAINNMPNSLADMVANGADLTSLPSIGKDLSEKIKTIVQTGELPALKEIEKHVPPILSQLMELEGLGPHRVEKLYKELHVCTMEDLQQAIASDKLSSIRGFGRKITQKLAKSLVHLKDYQKRIKLVTAMPVAKSLLNYLKAIPGIKQVEIAGSYRRRQETVGDLDILATAQPGTSIIEHFIKYEEISEVLSSGITRSTVYLNSGIQVDLRVVPDESFGSALLYFTGSKSHSIALRKKALQKKLKINEYGLFKGKKRIAGKTEEEIYHKIGLNYIEPELRENRGEIEKAAIGELPQLVALSDIRGDLHCHTKLTDGSDTLETMAKAAIKLGYEYLAITDHSKNLTVAKGLNEKSLLKQIKDIDKFNEKLGKIFILKAVELDILKNGSLDFPLNILKQLDLTVCAIHSYFNLSRQKQTERIMRAMDNPCFNILAHPTGRLIGKREPYDVDIEKIMLSAKEQHCFLEVNAQPERLDLNDTYCKLAKDIQLKLVISTDAHSIHQFEYMKFGVYQAKRGWLEAKDVLNTRDLCSLRHLLKRD